MRAVVLFGCCAALVLPAFAAAHAVFTPPFVTAGEEVLVSLEVPNERAPHSTTEVTTSAPAGIDIVFANAPPGWLATVVDETATWRRGRIVGNDTATFPVRIIARARAGTYVFDSTQRYNDGATVRWKSNLAVLPAAAGAPDEHPWGAVAAALVGVVVIAISLAAVRLLRRRSLQDR